MGSGGGCALQAPVREFHVSAINVDITLNRFLDHDPQGRMYALDDNVPRGECLRLQFRNDLEGNRPASTSTTRNCASPAEAR